MDSESELLDRIRRAAGPRRRGPVMLGIGDDCAIYRPLPGEDLVFTTDMLVEDVHFSHTTHPAGAAGHKALARGLSDIAAMGASPRFCLISLALAPWTTTRWVSGFYRGLLRLAASTGTTLAGGDISHAGQLTCDVVVGGSVPRGQALRRDGAHAGDRIYCSGRLGASALGLASRRGAAWRIHQRPTPRLALGQFLRRRLRATACMDLSDGISLDLRRMCLASGLAASIAVPPAFPGATPEQALHGGEDYELLFTVRHGTAVPAAFEGLPLTCLGGMRRGHPGEVLLDGAPLAPLGYDHLRLRSRR